MTFYSSLQYIVPKVSINIHLKLKLVTGQFLYIRRSFSKFVALKWWLTIKFSKNFFDAKLSYKKG